MKKAFQSLGITAHIAYLSKKKKKQPIGNNAIIATQEQTITLPNYFYLCRKTIEIEKELSILSFSAPD